MDDPSTYLLILFWIILILLSGLISASEVAFFSLTPSDLSKIKESKKTQDKIIINHLNQPKFLLATILIANNIINIAIVILATYIFESNLVFSIFPFLKEILNLFRLNFSNANREGTETACILTFRTSRFS